jgi:hypothetical protein
MCVLTIPRSNYSPRGDGKARPARPEPPQLHFALLETPRPPENRLSLVAEAITGGNLKLKWEPLAAAGPQRMAIGLLEGNPGPAGAITATMPVWRGRRGSKPSENLTVIRRVPEWLLNLPASGRRGLLRSVQSAVDCTSSACSSPAFGAWAALRFAIEGFFRPSRDFPLWDEPDYSSLLESENVTEHSGFCIWDGYLQRCVDRLDRQIAARVASNPLFNKLDLFHVREWLGIVEQPVSHAVLAACAARYGLAVQPGFAPWIAIESLHDPAQEIRPADANAAARILEAYNTDAGQTRQKIDKAFPSQRHVPAWLFEARELIAGPDGFVFTRAELDRYSELLPQDQGVPAPGVKQLKETLNLNRRKAEGLRALLLAEHGGTPQRSKVDE